MQTIVNDPNATTEDPSNTTQYLQFDPATTFQTVYADGSTQVGQLSGLSDITGTLSDTLWLQAYSYTTRPIELPSDNQSVSLSRSSLSDGNEALWLIFSNEEHSDTIGFLLVPNTPQQTGSIGGFIWSDPDHNGIQDVGEVGISGVGVHLLDDLGNEIAVTSTDSNGFYQFQNIVEGNYSILVDRPDNMIFTLRNQGTDDTVDSDVDATGSSELFALLAGQNKNDLDAGLRPNQAPSASDDFYSTVQDQTLTTYANQFEYGVLNNDSDSDGDPLTVTAINGNSSAIGTALILPSAATVTMQSDGSFVYTPPALWTGQDSFTYTVSDGSATATATVTINVAAGATISGFVWEDANQDGLQDAGEIGIDGLFVQLFDEFETLIATTYTTNGGFYEFQELAAGNYYVVFEEPLDMMFTLQDQGADDTLDSDADATGKVGLFALLAGEHKDDLDAGLYWAI